MPITIRLFGGAIALLLIGCASSQPFPTEGESSRVRIPSAIAQFAHPPTALQDLSQAAVNTTVQIEGTVQAQAPLLDRWLYQITDSTGELWVMSTAAPPAVGETVRVQGVVRYEPILIGGTDQGDYYLEAESHTVIEPKEPEDAEVNSAS